MSPRSELRLKKIKPAPKRKKKKKAAEIRRRRIQLWHLLNRCPTDLIDQILEWIDDLGDGIANVLNKMHGEEWGGELKECEYVPIPRVLDKNCSVEIETEDNEKPIGALEIFRYAENGKMPGPGSDPLITHGGNGGTRVLGPGRIALHLKNRRTCKVTVRVICP
jgi:hypothetical protein